MTEGGLFAGVMELFACGDCRDVIGTLVFSTGRYDIAPPGPVDPRCPHCGGRKLTPWSAPGPCPRCGDEVQARTVGIAD